MLNMFGCPNLVACVLKQNSNMNGNPPITTNLRIASWNSRGFSSAIPYLREILKANDIVSISEHWLHNNQLSLLNDVSDNFTCFGRSSRFASEDNFGIRRGSGGVAIYWRKGLSGVSPLLNIKHDRICGIRIQTVNHVVINILSVYMPAAGSCEDLSTVIDELSCVIDSLDEGAVNIISGDLNGDVGAQGGPRSRRPPTRSGRIILSFLEKYNLVAANLLDLATGSVDTFSCHNGSSTIDYIIIPKAYIGNIVACHTISDNALNTSDHFPVSLVLKVCDLPGYIDCQKGRSSLRWDKIDRASMYDSYEKPLGDLIDDMRARYDVRAQEDIDLLFDSLVICIHQAAQGIPRSKYVSHLKPFWSEDLSQKKREKMYWFGLWKQQGRTLDDNDPVRMNMKLSKKIFRKTVKSIGRKYENDRIADAARLAEVDRDQFWHLFKRMKGNASFKVHAVKNKQDQVVYDIDSVLDVWRTHFSSLSTLRDSEYFDQGHYAHVTESVREWSTEIGHSPFLDPPFSLNEISSCIDKLHFKKAPGHDGVTAEHLRYGGAKLHQAICFLFNACVRYEFVPSNFRKGVQVPLYKGKNSCPLKPDNYRGITLLSSFNKLFEMVIWHRLEVWWESNRVISELQGACRKGSSCVHTALTLQETIAKQCESGKKVFVVFFDVSKAFDSVWIDGLFFQLHQLGIRDSLWRILYKGYTDFSCMVRIGDRTSLPYPMLCGIHQGGYLSLVKYIAFVNSLIVELKNSRLCCMVERVQSTPLGYADDLATCTLSGARMHRVLDIVDKHGRTWRYSFNAKKSAIMVFGESSAETAQGIQNRMFKLGDARVKETYYYDHVGIKICLKGDFHVRTEEKVKKARTTLNMATCMGVRKGGLNLYTCCLIYWTVVVPTLCFGCELWIMKKKDIQMLQCFQRYSARRLQRLHPRSLSATSRVCLGWLDIVRYIMARKAIFIRTIFVMKDYIPIKTILVDRIVRTPHDDIVPNTHNSPITDILNTCVQFNLMPCVRMMARGTILSKAKWKSVYGRELGQLN